MNTPASATPLHAIGERGLVELIRRRFPSPPSLLPVGIGDDAAVAVPERGALEILTTDAMVEGVHFDLAFCSPADVGFKSLAVNVSDVASMGGTARLALLSLILPSGMTVAEVEGLLDGFAAMASEAGVALAGGNITTSPGPLIVDVTVSGSVRPRKVLTRAGGRPGDALYVTGALGAAAAGLEWLRATRAGPADRPGESDLAACVDRYRRPEPRARLGAILGRSRAATACMDLSDGLADAVRQVAAASGVGARIDAQALPVAEGVRRMARQRDGDPVLMAAAGGDDYELLFAVPARRRGRLKTVVQQARGVAVTRIGELTAAPDVVLVRNGRAEELPAGFVHF